MFLYIKQLWIYKRVRRAYFIHFPLLAFIVVATLLLVGIAYLDSLFWLSLCVSLVLLLLGLSYYALYFAKYTKIVDAYSEEEYYFKVFSFWGISAFSSLFILCFALCVTVVNSLLFEALFSSASYEAVALYLFDVVIDGVSFGFLSSFDLSLCRILSSRCDLDPDSIVNVCVYLFSLVVEFAFLASAMAEIMGWIEAKKKVSSLLKQEKFEPESLSASEIKQIQIIIDKISAGNLDINEYEEMLVNTLSRSKSKAARNTFLFIMHTTHDMTIFTRCLSYFKENKDWRFKRVCKRIKDSRKQKLIKQFNAHQRKAIST